MGGAALTSLPPADMVRSLTWCAGPVGRDRRTTPLAPLPTRKPRTGSAAAGGERL